MPLYEYRCADEACNHTFDHLAKSHREPAPDCPECGAEKPKKQISRTSFSLQGSGWAADGYSGGASVDAALGAIDSL